MEPLVWPQPGELPLFNHKLCDLSCSTKRNKSCRAVQGWNLSLKLQRDTNLKPVTELKRNCIHWAAKIILLLVHPLTPNCFIEAICNSNVQVTFEFHGELSTFTAIWHRLDFLPSWSSVFAPVQHPRGRNRCFALLQTWNCLWFTCLKYSSNNLKLFLIHLHYELNNQE